MDSPSHRKHRRALPPPSSAPALLFLFSLCSKLELALFHLLHCRYSSWGNVSLRRLIHHEVYAPYLQRPFPPFNRVRCHLRACFSESCVSTTSEHFHRSSSTICRILRRVSSWYVFVVPHRISWLTFVVKGPNRLPSVDQLKVRHPLAIIPRLYANLVMIGF